jgi:hypothetical protein
MAGFINYDFSTESPFLKKNRQIYMQSGYKFFEYGKERSQAIKRIKNTFALSNKLAKNFEKDSYYNRRRRQPWTSSCKKIYG